jgi:hypothetical protein
MSHAFKRTPSQKATSRKMNDELLMERLERAHFQFFVDYQNKDTGLILDRTRLDGPATIAGVGFALPAYGAASTRSWISRDEAVAYTIKVLRVLWNVPQGDGASGTNGFRGFYYHFLNPKTGERAVSPQFWNSELSSIDTALLMAGVRFARNFYLKRNAAEKEIRELCDKIYERVEWDWLVHDDGQIGHGWTPETGLFTNVYSGYSEALLLYLLAMGSPTHPAPEASWKALQDHFKVVEYYGRPMISMPGTPLFCYQYPHCWVDFRGIKDSVNRRLGFDYFENSRRATTAQHQYACENPQRFRGYNKLSWGLTACDGPGDVTKVIDGKERQFFWYRERGAPDGADDGTIAPTAAMSSLPYNPRLVLATARKWLKDQPELFSMHGFADAYNPTFGDPAKPESLSGWVDPERIAIDQGPVVLMFENYRSGLIWTVMKRDPVLLRALRKAGFTGGWLKKRTK